MDNRHALPAFYRIANGRVWDTARACFVSSVPEGDAVVPLHDGATPASVEYLRQTLTYYGLPLGEIAPLEDVKAAKTAEVLSGYDAALAASLTMPVDSPTAQDVSIGAALFAVDDAEGLAFVRETHAARRDELLAAVEAADTVEAVQTIEVSYAV